MKLTNNSGRALGVPSAFGSSILQPKQSIDISPLDLTAIERNRIASNWLHSGLISVDGAKTKAKDDKVEKKKEAKVQVKTEESDEVAILDHGRGWFTVEVAGIEVSQGKLRKDDAEALAAQYADEPESGED